MRPACVGDVLGPHGAAEFPADDVAGLVVEDRGQVKPAPADDLEIGKIGLPHLVWCGGIVLELIRSLDGDIGGVGDQVARLQQAEDRSL